MPLSNPSSGAGPAADFPDYAGLEFSVDLAPSHPRGLSLTNPVIIASGTFGYDGYGRGLTPEMDLSRLGAVIPKTFTRHPREGNPEPRWYPESFRVARETHEPVMLNAIGLTNPGIEAGLQQLAPQWNDWDATVLLSMSGESVDQFGEMAMMTRGVTGFEAIELNLSCPNVEQGDLFSYSASGTYQAVDAVKRHAEVPVLAKLAPNVPDIVPIARAAVDAGADALTICNTIPAMTIDLESRRPALGNITGGLSGPGLHPVAVALVYRAAQAVNVPIIGVGGIFTAEEALEFILAGASAIQVGSANLADLWAPFKILEDMRSFLGERGIADVKELIGAVQE
ncbi:MAG: dihydroorotate dehydrogenase [Chloroflexi bacterium]|nr:dihydroorotate dehydrogenase [Chloroflexota bacterium]